MHKQFPADLDIAMLYVESMMDLRPWGYWMPDGRPHEGTAEIVALTEHVLRAQSRSTPARCTCTSTWSSRRRRRSGPRRPPTRCCTLMPAAGHMVHMPSHIYQRVGRYADAMKSNQLAIAADEDYITQCRAQGLYPMGYYPHNVHFLWFAATFDGQSAVAIDAARKVAGEDPRRGAGRDCRCSPASAWCPYWAHVASGAGQEMLKEPAPPASNVYLRARVALRARPWPSSPRARPPTARARAGGAARRAGATRALDSPLFSPNTGRAILSHRARQCWRRDRRRARRVRQRPSRSLEHAVRLEDALVYTEPSEWHSPPRHALGAVLLEAGRPAEAETVYWEDLRATARTAGRCSAWRRRCARRRRTPRPRSSRPGARRRSRGPT